MMKRSMMKMILNDFSKLTMGSVRAGGAFNGKICDKL